MSDPHRPRSDHPKRTYFPDDLGFGGPPETRFDSFFRIRGSSGPPGSTMKTAVWTRTAPPPRRIQSSDASSKRPVTASWALPTKARPGRLDSRHGGSRAWSAGTTCRRRRSSGPSPTAATCRCSISCRRDTASASLVHDTPDGARGRRARTPSKPCCRSTSRWWWRCARVVRSPRRRSVTTISWSSPRRWVTRRKSIEARLVALLGADTDDAAATVDDPGPRRRRTRRARGREDTLAGWTATSALHRELRGAAPPRSA